MFDLLTQPVPILSEVKEKLIALKTPFTEKAKENSDHFNPEILTNIDDHFTYCINRVNSYLSDIGSFAYLQDPIIMKDYLKICFESLREDFRELARWLNQASATIKSNQSEPLFAGILFDTADEIEDLSRNMGQYSKELSPGDSEECDPPKAPPPSYNPVLFSEQADEQRKKAQAFLRRLEQEKQSSKTYWSNAHTEAAASATNSSSRPRPAAR